MPGGPGPEVWCASPPWEVLQSPVLCCAALVLACRWDFSWWEGKQTGQDEWGQVKFRHFCFSKNLREWLLRLMFRRSHLIYYRYLEWCIYLGFPKNETTGYSIVRLPLWSCLLCLKCLTAAWAGVRRAFASRGIISIFGISVSGHSVTVWAWEMTPPSARLKAKVSLRICIKLSKTVTNMKSLCLLEWLMDK